VPILSAPNSRFHPPPASRTPLTAEIPKATHNANAKVHFRCMCESTIRWAFPILQFRVCVREVRAFGMDGVSLRLAVQIFGNIECVFIPYFCLSWNMRVHSGIPALCPPAPPAPAALPIPSPNHPLVIKKVRSFASNISVHRRSIPCLTWHTVSKHQIYLGEVKKKAKNIRMSRYEMLSLLRLVA